MKNKKAYEKLKNWTENHTENSDEVFLDNVRDVEYLVERYKNKLKVTEEEFEEAIVDSIINVF